MIILGIDPGSTRIGFGIIEMIGKKMSLVDYGVIEIKRQESSQLILKAAQAIEKIIIKHKPDIVGIEKLYFMKNIKTGIEVAQTRGALILEAAKSNIAIKEFSPSEVKSCIAGYGLADKKAVSKMSAAILGLKKDALKGYDDATDAVAIAITTAMNS